MRYLSVFIVSLFLCTIVFVPTASAAGLTVNSVSDAAASGDGACTLREAITNANTDTDTTGGDCAPGSGADTITLNVTGAIKLSSSLPAISTSITISGPGPAALTLDGNQNSAIFIVDPAGDLALDNLALTNAPDYRKPLNDVVNYGTLRVSNCAFTNTLVSIWNKSSGTVTISGSKFSGYAGNGGGLYNEGGTASVTGSDFSDNFGGGYGGAIQNEDGSLTVTGSTFTHNTVNFYGGAIDNNRGTLTVTGSTFTNNATDYDTTGGGGGAISNRSGKAVITNSTFTDNDAGYWIGSGGAIISEGSTALTVSGSTFTGNHADGGGGAISTRWYSSATIDHSTFSRNFGPYGGAVRNDQYSTLTVTDSIFSANLASYSGGGIDNNVGSQLAVTNSTFSGNSASAVIGYPGYGGAISNMYYCTATITNSTFANNSASSLTNEIYVMPDVHGSVTLKNTIVANALSGVSCSGEITDGGYNLDSGTSCGFSAANHSYPGTDPLLDPAGLRDNGGPTQTIALQPGSPAIDAVPLAACAGLTADQRGVPRPQGPACDIGAYERKLSTPTELAGDLQEKIQALVGSGALNKGQGNALTATLDAALQQLANGKPDVALHQIQAFIHQVEGLVSSGALPPEDGQPLIDEAQEIVALLGG